MVRSDPSLPVLILLLLGAGLLTLSSAAPGGEFVRQLAFLGVGLAASGMMMWLGKRRILRFVPHLYVASMALLVLVQLFGTRVNGAKSWLYLGPLPGFQPSELAKLALILALAAVLHDRPIAGPMGTCGRWRCCSPRSRWSSWSPTWGARWSWPRSEAA